MQLVLRSAAVTDPAAARVYEQIQRERLTGMAYFAQHLHDGGHLRAELTSGRSCGPRTPPSCGVSIIALARGTRLPVSGFGLADIVAAAAGADAERAPGAPAGGPEELLYWGLLAGLAGGFLTDMVVTAGPTPDQAHQQEP